MARRGAGGPWDRERMAPVQAKQHIASIHSAYTHLHGAIGLAAPRTTVHPVGAVKQPHGRMARISGSLELLGGTLIKVTDRKIRPIRPFHSAFTTALSSMKAQTGTQDRACSHGALRNRPLCQPCSWSSSSQ